MTSVLGLYHRVMSLECKGLCWDTCGPVAASDPERTRIMAYSAQHRIPFTDLTRDRALRQFMAGLAGAPDEELMCPYLVDHRCSIYPVRPMICRLWGATAKLPCSHGCEPRGGRLTEDQAQLLLDWSGKVAPP